MPVPDACTLDLAFRVDFGCDRIPCQQCCGSISFGVDPAAIYGPGECKRVYCRRRSLEIRIFAIKQFGARNPSPIDMTPALRMLAQELQDLPASRMIAGKTSAVPLPS